MSRCFPFPPPGYVLNGTRDKALIESIKCTEEKAKKEQRRKERKREKKEKKRKERGEDDESQKHRHKRRHKEEGEVAKDGQNQQKVDVFRKSGNDCCLEKSSLTVERELLQSTSQNSCDSTVNSNDLSNQPPFDDGRHNNDSESIIRIRLPTRRQKDPDLMMMTDKDQWKPFPSRATMLDSSELATRKQPDSSHYPCSTSAPEHSSEPHEVKRKLGKEKISSSTCPETSQSSRLCSICPPSIAEQFSNLVENWGPTTIERRLDEECWWLSRSHEFSTESCKQLNRNNNESKQVISSSMAWPRARLLPEADVYALPYTIPY